MSAFHNAQTAADGIHILSRWEYVDVAARDAAAYTADDIGGVARVGPSEPYQFFLLTNATVLAWIEFGAGGGGGGTFSGPGSSTTGTLVSFADTTGNLGADSGVVATDVVTGPVSAVVGNISQFSDVGGKIISDSTVSTTVLANIPSTLPVGIGEGGLGSTTVNGAREALARVEQGVLWVDPSYGGANADGSRLAPFTTISLALAAIPAAGSMAEQQQEVVIQVAAGYYDEDLAIPDLRNITIRSDGLWVLNVPALNSTRNITVDHVLASLSPGPINVRLQNLVMGLGGTVIMNCDPTTGNGEYWLYLDDCRWIGTNTNCISSDGFDTTGGSSLRIEAQRCHMETTHNMCIWSNNARTDDNVAVSLLQDCQVVGNTLCIQAGGYGRFEGCVFLGSMNFQNLAVNGGAFMTSVRQPVGMYDCRVQGQGGNFNFNCLGLAGDFKVDSVTYETFRIDNGTTSGAGSFTGDPIQNTSNAFYDDSNAAIWVAGGNADVIGSIERLAAQVVANSGGAPIP